MTVPNAGTHASRPRAIAIAILAITTVLSSSLAPPPAAAQQPLPIRELAYSAKFLCGAGRDESIGDFVSLPRDAQEMTVIEVHNPHSIPVTCTIKWVQDYPTNQIVIPPYQVTLQSNEALNLDCQDLYLPGCPPVCGGAFRGFVEIRTPQQLKVVALYKEIMGGPGMTVNVAISRNSLLPFVFPPFISHSGPFLAGGTATAAGDSIVHESTVALTNMSNGIVNATVKIIGTAGPITTFLKLLQPNGFATVTGADLPPLTPLPFVGSVKVEYNDLGLGALLACEAIIQKHLIAGPRNASMAMSVVEVQPIPLR